MTILLAEEVARRLRVSPSTISKLVANGHLRGYRIGRCLRISKEALDQYLQGVITECHSNGEEAPKSGKSGSRCEGSVSVNRRAQRLAERLRGKSEISEPTTNAPCRPEPKGE